MSITHGGGEVYPARGFVPTYYEGMPRQSELTETGRVDASTLHEVVDAIQLDALADLAENRFALATGMFSIANPSEAAEGPDYEFGLAIAMVDYTHTISTTILEGVKIARARSNITTPKAIATIGEAVIEQEAIRRLYALDYIFNRTVKKEILRSPLRSKPGQIVRFFVGSPSGASSVVLAKHGLRHKGYDGDDGPFVYGAAAGQEFTTEFETAAREERKTPAECKESLGEVVQAAISPRVGIEMQAVKEAFVKTLGRQPSADL